MSSNLSVAEGLSHLEARGELHEPGGFPRGRWRVRSSG
jgi:hypothetical protein